MIIQIKIDIKHSHAIAVIILVKHIYLKKDLGLDIIFHCQHIRPCTVTGVSKVIGQVIRVPFPITGIDVESKRVTCVTAGNPRQTLHVAMCYTQLCEKLTDVTYLYNTDCIM